MRRPARFGPTTRTRVDKEAALVRHLSCASADALARMTVDGLCRTHGCDERFTEYRLMIARQNRAASSPEDILARLRGC